MISASNRSSAGVSRWRLHILLILSMGKGVIDSQISWEYSTAVADWKDPSHRIME